MENIVKEDVLQALTEFGRKADSPIPRLLEDYLRFVARTGDTVFPWHYVKSLVRRKIEQVLCDFLIISSPDSVPLSPNVDPFKYALMKEKILEALDYFIHAPFTIQRLCELMVDPKRYYKRIDKLMRAIEKNLLVTTMVEPRRPGSPNGDAAAGGAGGPQASGQVSNGYDERAANGHLPAGVLRTASTPATVSTLIGLSSEPGSCGATLGSAAVGTPAAAAASSITTTTSSTSASTTSATTGSDSSSNIIGDCASGGAPVSTQLHPTASRAAPSSTTLMTATRAADEDEPMDISGPIPPQPQAIIDCPVEAMDDGEDECGEDIDVDQDQSHPCGDDTPATSSSVSHAAGAASAVAAAAGSSMVTGPPTSVVVSSSSSSSPAAVVVVMPLATVGSATVTQPQLAVTTSADRGASGVPLTASLGTSGPLDTTAVTLPAGDQQLDISCTTHHDDAKGSGANSDSSSSLSTTTTTTTTSSSNCSSNMGRQASIANAGGPATAPSSLQEAGALSAGAGGSSQENLLHIQQQMREQQQQQQQQQQQHHHHQHHMIAAAAASFERGSTVTAASIGSSKSAEDCSAAEAGQSSESALSARGGHSGLSAGASSGGGAGSSRVGANQTGGNRNDGVLSGEDCCSDAEGENEQDMIMMMRDARESGHDNELEQQVPQFGACESGDAGGLSPVQFQNVSSQSSQDNRRDIHNQHQQPQQRHQQLQQLQEQQQPPPQQQHHQQLPHVGHMGSLITSALTRNQGSPGGDQSSLVESSSQQRDGDGGDNNSGSTNNSNNNEEGIDTKAGHRHGGRDGVVAVEGASRSSSSRARESREGLTMGGGGSEALPLLESRSKACGSNSNNDSDSSSASSVSNRSADQQLLVGVGSGGSGGHTQERKVGQSFETVPAGGSVTATTRATTTTMAPAGAAAAAAGTALLSTRPSSDMGGGHAGSGSSSSGGQAELDTTGSPPGNNEAVAKQ